MSRRQGCPSAWSGGSGSYRKSESPSVKSGTSKERAKWRKKIKKRTATRRKQAIPHLHYQLTKAQR